MPSYRSIWISDIHLGTKGCKAEELCAFLKDNHCENLYLVGDIIDGWKLSRGWNWPQPHSNVIRRLITKAKRGTNIVYIVGNHDEFLRPWLKHGIDIGTMTVVNETIHTDAKGRTWLITHGDMFDQVTRHHKWVSLLGDRAYGFLLMSNGWLHAIRMRFGLGYWSLSQYLKSKTKQAVGFICRFEEHLAAHAKDQNVHGVICGHIHTPTIKDIGGVIYANDGDWVESCSALVETLDGEFKLLMLGKTGTMDVIASYK